MPTDPLKLDAHVELLDQFSNVYPLSPTGARGWVRARRQLPKVDPEIYIEWDKHHWRYHGERDGWTFEHHFRLVDDTVPEPADIGMDRILEAARRQVEEERCPECGELHAPEDDYLTALAEGSDAAVAAEGFFMMTLSPETKDGLVLYEPHIHTACLTPMAQEMLRAQLLFIAAQIYQEEVSVRIEEMEDPGEPGP